MPFTAMGNISREDRIVMKTLRVATSGKNLSSRRYIKEFVSQKWSKSHLDRLIRKVDAGWPTDSFIDQGRMCDFLWKSAARMRRTRDDTRGAPSVLPIH